MKNKISEHIICEYLDELFPNAHCELNYSTIFQLLVAVSLSAQTTDAAVNLVTPKLFEKYPTCFELAKENLNDVEELIKRIGLYKNKAKNIIAAAKMLPIRSLWNPQAVCLWRRWLCLPMRTIPCLI